MVKVWIGDLDKRNRFGILPHEMVCTKNLVFSKGVYKIDENVDERKESDKLYKDLRNLALHQYEADYVIQTPYCEYIKE